MRIAHDYCYTSPADYNPKYSDSEDLTEEDSNKTK